MAPRMSASAHLEVIREVFSDAPEPVLVLDASGRLLFASRGAAPHLGTGDRVGGDTALGRAVLPLLAEGTARRVEWGDSSAGGVKTWYACSLSPVPMSEGPPAWLCVCTEITELKRNEERLRRSEQLMVDTQGVAHLGTWEWDVSEPHAFWSAELYRIYGLTPDAYTPSYDAYLQMVHPDDRQRVMDATNRVFQEHVPYSHDERIFRPDGSLRYLHTWAHPILDDQGKLQRLVGVCQDITDRAEAEEKVKQINLDLERRVSDRTRELEDSMRDLEAFNAIVGHDLRSPLNAIELASAALARSGADADGARITRARERIGRAVIQMTSLIDDLLAFARLGKASLEKDKVDLSVLAGEVVADLRLAAPERVVDVSIESGISCFGDRALMRVALQNLLGNAWKYTARTAGARISVTSSASAQRRILTVRDNGAGFDMKDAHRLFAPFQRLHSEREFAGTGLGLASVQRILERHGGRVWAEGTPGAGAAFFVELPDGAR